MIGTHHYLHYKLGILRDAAPSPGCGTWNFGLESRLSPDILFIL